MRNPAALALFALGVFLLIEAAAFCQGELRAPVATDLRKQPSQPQSNRLVAPLVEVAVGKNGRLIFVPAKINGHTVRLLVDTGCTRSGLDQRYSAIMGPPIGKASLKTSSGSVAFDQHAPVKIEINGVPLRSESPIFSQDFTHIRSLTGEEISGVLGMDVLHHYVLQIDFDFGILRIFDALPASPEKLGESHDLVSQLTDAPVVAAQCGSLSRNFMLDTGSTTSAVDHATFDELAQLGEIRTGNGYGVGTPTGQVKAKVGLMRNLSLGKSSHSNLLCDSDVFNVLGLRYLSRYQLTLDSPRRTVYLREGRNYVKPDPTGLSGLRPTRGPDGWTVTAVSPGGAASLAGIVAGDIILDIDGEPSSTMDLYRIGEVLTSRPGSFLKLKLRRNDREIVATLTTQDRFATHQARR